jgi:serine/threonine-protein kinase
LSDDEPRVKPAPPALPTPTTDGAREELTPTLSGAASQAVPAPGETPSTGHILAGRYIVLGLLGRGGMGQVLAAYDVRLDRRVALKLLHPEARGDGTGSNPAQVRLMREAQAMARLSHPHVVAVYDTGEVGDGSIFIAMEYVKGQTLRAWQRAQPRFWREVLGQYLAAARGLAAAHDAGLVHRDFKPENVLVGEDGRVRVTDFGVARASPLPSDSEADAPPLPLPPVAAWELPLTEAGVVVGTPHYLAPEVLRGRPADARGDIFAFCVALYEALYAQPAFPGRTSAERARMQLEGRASPPPDASPVPAWLGQVVMRGLALEPGQRPASMQELMGALGQDPERRRAARLRMGALAVTGLGLATLAAVGWSREQGAPACAAMEKRLAGVWDAPTREEVRRAFLATGQPSAPDSFTRVATALDAYASTWARLRTEVCESTPRQAAPGALADLEARCLERRRGQLRSLTELLARDLNPELVPRAMQVVGALPPLEDCTDARVLAAEVPLPASPQERERAEALQQQVDRLGVLLAAGHFRQGMEAADSLRPEVESLGHAPLRAALRFWQALLKEDAGDYSGAEALAREALPLAAQGQDDALVARTWSTLLRLVGDRKGRLDEALALALPLETAVERADTPPVRAEARHDAGTLLYRAGRYGEARERLEEAVALKQRAFGPGHLELASTLNNLGIVLQVLGRDEEALERHSRALALRRAALGPEHPDVAVSHNNLAILLSQLGRNEEAREQLAQALALQQRTLGPEHPQVAGTLNNLGAVLRLLGRNDEAREHISRALGIREKVLGPEHPEVAQMLANLGAALHQQGRYEEARARLERALAIQRKALAPGHPEVALTLGVLGDVSREQGLLPRARAQLEEAQAVLEKALGAGHPEVARALTLLGRTLLRQRQWAGAEAHLQRALGVLERSGTPVKADLQGPLLGLGELRLGQGRPSEAVAPLERALTLGEEAEVGFALARALWDSDADRPRAVALAQRARTHWERVGHPTRLAEVSRWLAGRK